eukprot:COSAG05_NODE_139_length_16772_cov_35.582559_6_plen_307_part_00
MREVDESHQAQAEQALDAVRKEAVQAVALTQQNWARDKKQLCDAHAQGAKAALDAARKAYRDEAEEAQLAQAQAHAAQLARLRNEMQAAVEAAEEADAAPAQLRQRLEVQTRDLEAAEASAEENRQARFESEKQARSSSRERELMRGRLQTAEAKEKESRETVDTYAIKLAELQASINILESEKQQLAAAVKTASTANATNKKDRAALEQKLQEQQAQAQAAQQALAEAKQNARDTASTLNEEVCETTHGGSQTNRLLNFAVPLPRLSDGVAVIVLAGDPAPLAAHGGDPQHRAGRASRDRAPTAG